VYPAYLFVWVVVRMKKMQSFCMRICFVLPVEGTSVAGRHVVGNYRLDIY